MVPDQRRALVFRAPRDVAVVQESVPAPAPDEVVVRTIASGISPGTERLIYTGNAPQSLSVDATLRSLKGDTLSFPLRYGYACVGRVVAVGSEVKGDWAGQKVFAFVPHQSAFACRPDQIVRLPASVESATATLLPSLETAVNLVMDAGLRIGEEALVMGQGVVGLLATALLARHPLAALHVVEPAPQRRARAREQGATAAFAPDDRAAIRDALGITTTDAVPAGETYQGADVTIEISGQTEALQDAIQYTGYRGRIVVGSWYGTDPAALNLGGRFHRSRMRLLASQVSTIDPSHRGRWTKARRMQTVLSLLDELALDDLVTHTYSIDEAARAYEDLVAADPAMLQPIFRYA